jgi:cAMP-binding proteins - catabolite gene activator and regulatory subunit of cAMP-dependent protein kinases
MEKDVFENLQGIELFSGIHPDDLRTMMACFDPTVRRYTKGEIAVIAGDPLSSIGIVLSGEVEVMRENAAGGKSIIAFISKGNTFGEIAAFSGQKVWPSTVSARKESTLVFIPPDHFLGNCPRACGFHKTLIQNMLKILSEKTIRLSRKAEYLGIKSMRAKLCMYLLEQQGVNGSSTFVLPMNRNELADYLNVSRPSMSRELGRLRAEGLLDFHLSSVRLLDAEALRKMTVT